MSVVHTVYTALVKGEVKDEGEGEEEDNREERGVDMWKLENR